MVAQDTLTVLGVFESHLIKNRRVIIGLYSNDEVIWKRMIYHGKDLGDYYLVSNTGEVMGVKTGKVRKKNISHEGYYFISVSLGSRKNKPYIKIHRAVAETFIDNTKEYQTINHRDGNKLNNSVENLEFCTYQENTIHAYKNGLTTKNIPVICLNNGISFYSMEEASRWAGLKCVCSLKDFFKNKNRQSCGKHPITGEKLQWRKL